MTRDRLSWITLSATAKINRLLAAARTTSPIGTFMSNFPPDRQTPRLLIITAALICLTMLNPVLAKASAQDTRTEVFSGPQPDEKTAPLPIRLALGTKAGSDFDPVTTASPKPLLLIFVHDINRQSISMTRVLSGYAASRADADLQTSVIFLADDLPAMEAQIQRMQHALTPDVPTGISIDGREGPGTWGLNRNVTLTIVISRADKVVANYALIQPSLQADLPRILKSLVAEIGGELPPLDKLPGMPQMTARSTAGSSVPDMRALLTPVIRRDASEEDVRMAAEKVAARAEADPAVRAELARISTTIVNSGKLSSYGTSTAQEYLKKWARQYGSPAPKQTAPETPK